jgi:hypothetical protein
MSHPITHGNDLETTRTTPAVLQVDATEQDGFSAAGFVLLDHNRQYISRFSQELGKGYPGGTASEHEAVVRGLKLLKERTDIKHVKVETDCKPVVHEVDTDYWERYFDYITIENIPRTENDLADMMADTAIERTPYAELTEEVANEPDFGVCD